MFDQLHTQGSTSFVLKYSYGCSTCFNVRLLRVRNLFTSVHTYKVGVLAQWAARGQKTVRKSPPAPSPQTKASEKELGGFFGRFFALLLPTVSRTPTLYVCVCAVPELGVCAVPELRVCAVPELRHERCARTVCV